MADPADIDTESQTQIAEAPPAVPAVPAAPAAPPPFVLPSSQKAQPTPVPADTKPFFLPSEAHKQPPLPPGGGLVPETYPLPGSVEGEEAPTRGALGPGYEDYPTIADLPIDKLPRTPGAGTEWYSPDLELAKRKAALTFGTAMPETAEGRQNVIKENLPGATFETDKFGNPLVVYEGKKYHIDRPDSFNKQNVGHGIIQAAPTAALTTAALAAGPVGWILGAAEMASAGYLGNQFRAWMGREAGSGEQRDLTSSSSILEGVINAIIPVVGKIGTTVAKRFGSPATSETSPGVQRVLVTKEAAEEAFNRAHPDDLYFHTNPDNAANLVRQLPYTETAKKVEAAAAQHAQAAPARVAKGLDETVGPANASIKQTIDTVKGPASKELTDALAQSGPLNIQPLVASIDESIAKAGNTPTGRALQKLRSMLVEQEGTAGTASTREAVEGTIPGRTIMREVPGTPGTETKYVTDAQKLNDIKREFDRLLKYGDKAAGIEPRSISATDMAVGNVRKDLSGILNTNVQGYEELMKRYQTAYEMHDAYVTGQKIMTGGKNALDLEQVAPYLQGSPHEAEAFRIGVRDAIDSVIRTAAKDRDAGAIKKIVSGDNSYRREILNEMYGKEKIDALVQMAEREGNYAAINQQLIEAVEQGRAMQGISQAGKLKEPVVGTVVPYATPTAIALNTGSRILNRIGAFLAGSQGKGFESKLANTLTSPAKPVLEAIRNGAKPAVNEIGAVTSPAVPAAIAESHRGQKREKLPRAAGGRVKLDCAGKASELCRQADRIRRKHALDTQVILNQSDDAVADALAVASRGL